MITIALRFSDHFAPEKGTIQTHKELIAKNGFVWYGKLGNPVSDKVISQITNNTKPRILLIHSGKTRRYWAYIKRVQHELPQKDYIPEYYRERAEQFKTWFLITKIEDANRDVLSKCVVLSSGRKLSEVSRSSMSPYFIINAE